MMNLNEDRKQEGPNKDIEGETRARKAQGEQNKHTTGPKSDSIVMFLNCTFICCHIKSMFDYFLGTRKALISWYGPQMS